MTGFMFALKVLISSLVISSSSWLAARKPVLAGFLVALPLVSVLSLAMTYFESRDMEKVNQFAISIVAAVPLSLIFFVPFILNRWLRMNFTLTFAFATGGLFIAYVIHRALLKG